MARKRDDDEDLLDLSRHEASWATFLSDIVPPTDDATYTPPRGMMLPSERFWQSRYAPLRDDPFATPRRRKDDTSPQPEG